MPTEAGYNHCMSVGVVYETHSISVDNERGIATGGWKGRSPVPGERRRGVWASGGAMMASLRCSPRIFAARSRPSRSHSPGLTSRFIATGGFASATTDR